MMKRFLLILALILLPVWAWGATYYVDCNAAAGGDGSLATPWDTIADVNGASFSGDDNIILADDCLWREKLTVPSSGTSGHPITFKRSGTGTNKPILTGADLMTTWVNTTPGNKTGSVTGANMRLSTVANNAFVDFGVAYSLTPYIGSKITITDDASKTLVGYIRAAGTGETYSDELITTNANAEATDVPSTASVALSYFQAEGARSDEQKHAGTYSWKVTTTATGNASGCRLIPNLTVGKLHKSSVWIYYPAGMTTTGIKSSILMNSVALTRNTITATNTWTQSTTYPTMALNTDRLFYMLGNADYAIGDYFYLDDFTLKEVLTPSATGVTIYDAASGGTQSWTSMDAGFKLNMPSATKYTYTIEVALPANVWTKTGVTTDANVLLYNGALGTKKDYLNECTSEGYWAFDTDLNAIFLYSTSDPDTAYTNPGVEASQRTYAIFNPKDYITIENLDLRGATVTGLRVVSTDIPINLCTIDGVESSYNYEHGIEYSNTESGNAITGGLVKNSIAHHNGRDGIRAISQNVAHGDISGITIQDCTVYSNNYRWDTGALDGGGVKFCGPYVHDITVQRNTIYNNGDLLPDFQDYALKKRTGHGIHFDTMGANSIARYNKIYNNNHSQITAEIGDGVQLYYNVIYNNPGACGISVWSWGGNAVTNTLVYNNTVYGHWGGICVWGENTVADDITGNLVKNNISVGNTFNLYANNGGENDGTKGSGNVYEYNCFGDEAADFITWGAATPDTYDAWEALYGGTTHSVEADPLFVSAATGNFKLRAGSPAINAGTDVSLTTDYAGRVVPSRGVQDIGAYEFYGWPKSLNLMGIGK